MRTLAIGDIHGCYTSLTTLWDYVKPSHEDHLIFLGDYVDRGPKSKQVVDFLIEKSKTYKLTFLTGNHEEKLLLARYNELEYAQWIDIWDATATMDSYETQDISEIPAAHWDFFRKNLPYFETETHIFVHANLEPDIPLAEQQPFTLIHKKLGIQQPHISGKTVICGHTAQKNHLPKNLGHTICIDTDAGRDGWLTCLEVNSGELWQSNEAQATRTSVLN